MGIDGRYYVANVLIREVLAKLKGPTTVKDSSCSIPNDHIDPRRSAFFMARSVLRYIQSGVLPC
jgi:hypothetical protein